MSTAPHQRIDDLVKQNKIIVFMKGNKLMPQCGFSNNVVQILNRLGVPYETVDVLADQEIRQGVKEYSNWPTIPQVYINGKFLGGSDILIEMYQKGELQEAVEVALAS
ncbi:MAG: Grx4 family monothiol glutaredoxin [Tychonema bourrellyi B0820]|uniref:Glutaredoxin n=1 Tax=Tychonema bourrellyi FEM_GT703 TaxID=2040638 RepID=A0A2G4EZF5_9CYAN|nr:Grx4 family monothiol glutaredoxin [Tychonema bourrellyi]MDQ2100752.1 Grx4 family monothiol glutaredoxin [Tychonema bourrellyi B0820]PHX54894.1 monothiol glutaredoxin, Grx4 family [Tychonema bourrellyi FEM_GT703]